MPKTYTNRRARVLTALPSFALLLAGGCEALAGLDDLHVRSASDFSDGAVAQEGGAPGSATDAQVLPVNDASSCSGSDCTSAAGNTDAGTTASDAAPLRPESGASEGGPAAADAATAPDGSPSDASWLDAKASDAAPVDANPGVVEASTGDATPSTPDASTMPMDLGKGDGSDVVLIGDSWMSNTLQTLGTGGGISPALVSASKQPYRNYAVQGVMLLADSLFGLAIPTQWDKAKSVDADIKTVVMTAGGNDITQGSSNLQSDCMQGGALCANKLKDVRTALGNLWAQMAASGVRDIVHIMYAKVSGMQIKDADAHAEALKVVCSNVPAPARCHLFFTDAYVTSTALTADGSHPTAGANSSIATALLDLMAAQGMRR